MTKILIMRAIAVAFMSLLFAAPPAAAGADRSIVVAQAAETATVVTPEERMRRRFPQPVRAGDLIGLRMLDDDDVTIGFVRRVVRTPERKILLIVSYGGWFGWGARPVAVPIEAVAIFGRQLASLDMEPKEYAAAPTWPGTGAEPLADSEIIRIGLTRR